MVFRVKCAGFTSQWQGIGVFFEPRSTAKAAGFLKAYLCASCLVLLQGTKDTGAIQLAALLVMQGEELCCTGCVALAALRNWSCVYLLPVIGCIFKTEKGGFPLQDCRCSLLRSALWLQRERDPPLGKQTRGRPVLFASCSTDAAFAWVSAVKIICQLTLIWHQF